MKLSTFFTHVIISFSLTLTAIFVAVSLYLGVFDTPIAVSSTTTLISCAGLLYMSNKDDEEEEEDIV